MAIATHKVVIVRLWLFSEMSNNQSLGFYSLLFLAQALEKQKITTSTQIMVVTNNMQDVVGNEKIYPEKATVLGPCMVIDAVGEIFLNTSVAPFS